jgi:hypothetical protein
MIEQVTVEPRLADLLCSDPSDVTKLMAGLISSEPDIGEFEDIKRETSSMLHVDSLCLISYLASIVEGPILEIGAYTGGATISAVKGLLKNESNKSCVVSIESGKYDTGKWEKPLNRGYSMTYEKVFNTLVFNISAYANRASPENPEKVTDRVKVIEGLSHNIYVMDDVASEVKRELGLLVIDADGNVQRDLDIYLSCLKKGGYIVIDDYIIETDGYGKEEGSQDAVHRLVNSGCAISLGVYKWGTWIGQKVV